MDIETEPVEGKQLSFFLTEEELIDFTGAAQPATQERVLQEMGLNVKRNRLNRVKLAREALIRFQLGEKVKMEKEPELRLLRDLKK